jgi:sugar phosphate isomerase/epimerase
MTNRRKFLLLASAIGTRLSPAQVKGAQQFIAGTCAGGREAETFLKACDECSTLGYHYVESGGAGVRLVDVYASDPSKLKDEFDKRHLTLIGYAHYCSMADPAKRDELISLHLRIGRMLKPLGTKYITHLLIPPEKPGVPAQKLPAAMTPEDFKNFGRNANEVAKRLREETGLRIGYHAETVDVAAGLVDPVMEAADPRYFDLVADVGHLTAGGLDPIQVCKKYSSRIITAHLRDYDPDLEFERNGQKMKGRFVPLGQGKIDLPGLLAYFEQIGFKGQVMAEGGGFGPSRDYMVQKLSLKV